MANASLLQTAVCSAPATHTCAELLPWLPHADNGVTGGVVAMPGFLQKFFPEITQEPASGQSDFHPV